MADYSRDDWGITPHTPIPPVLTPRERGFKKRIEDLENVVSKLAKAVFDDDSLTTHVTYVTNTSNTPEPVHTFDQAKVAGLEKANAQLREEVEKKNQEIIRLTTVVHNQDSRLDEYHDSFIAIRNAVDELGDGW